MSQLLTIAEVLDNLHRGLFKPNCALGKTLKTRRSSSCSFNDGFLVSFPAVMVDFLVRHSFLTTKNEPHLIDITRRLHATLAVPGIVGR